MLFLCNNKCKLYICNFQCQNIKFVQTGFYWRVAIKSDMMPEESLYILWDQIGRCWVVQACNWWVWDLSHKICHPKICRITLFDGAMQIEDWAKDQRLFCLCTAKSSPFMTLSQSDRSNLNKAKIVRLRFKCKCFFSSQTIILNHNHVS